jgi:hypothetical protein
MHGTLSFIHFAFRLEFLVPAKFSSRILDGALGFIRSALHMFAIHVPFSAITTIQPSNAMARLEVPGLHACKLFVAPTAMILLKFQMVECFNPS